MKKLTLALALVLLLAALLGCTGVQEEDTDADTLALSWWIPAGADTSYYTTYEENPCMKYIEQTMTFNGQKVDLSFLVPAAGAELDLVPEWRRLLRRSC